MCPHPKNRRSLHNAPPAAGWRSDLRLAHSAPRASDGDWRVQRQRPSRCSREWHDHERLAGSRLLTRRAAGGLAGQTTRMRPVGGALVTCGWARAPHVASANRARGWRAAISRIRHGRRKCRCRSKQPASPSKAAAEASASGHRIIWAIFPRLPANSSSSSGSRIISGGGSSSSSQASAVAGPFPLVLPDANPPHPPKPASRRPLAHQKPRNPPLALAPLASVCLHLNAPPWIQSRLTPSSSTTTMASSPCPRPARRPPTPWPRNSPS